MTKPIRRILVAVNASEPRDAAFDRAVFLARGWNAELLLLHARPPQHLSRFATTGEDLQPTTREAGRSQVRALVRAANSEGVQVRVISAQGDAARAIAAHAQLVTADLIVIARTFGSSRLWRSTRVAATVGRLAPVPVLIVPSRKAAPHSPVTPFKRVVVAVDFTVASAVALRVATDVIAEAGGRGTVVHAMPYASPMVFSGSEAASVVDDWRDRVAQIGERLRAAIPAAASHLVKPRVVAGTAGRAILDVAADVDADLVVMGVSRRNRLHQLLFGSTFQNVVRRSLRPILAVPVAEGAYRWAGESSPGALSEAHLRVA